MTFPVKWYSSAMQGAPFLSSGSAGAAHTTNPGTLIALLKAILVTGFGNMALASASYDSAASTITLTTATTHAYLVDQIIEVSGANESGFNGEFRVVSVTSNKLVLALDNGTPAAATATGTLTIKIPSLGWAVEFEDAANYKVIFKRTNASSTPVRLLVDNSAWSGWNGNNGYIAKVIMVEDATDINTYTTIQEYRWPCSHSYALPEWQAVGDGMMLYFLPRYSAYANNYPAARGCFAFGDINSIRPGDKYHCLLAGHNEAGSWATGSYPYAIPYFVHFSNSNHKALARSYHQLAGSVSALWKGYNTYFGEAMSFPNPADNGFYVSTDPIPVYDNMSYRGTLPGVVVPYATTLSFDGANLKNLPALPNKIIRLVMTAYYQTSSSVDSRRLIGFDIKGPWR